MDIKVGQFDLAAIEDETWRYHYHNILQRGLETIQSLRKSYPREEEQLNVHLFYYRSNFLNAYASKEANDYLLGISAATLPLLVALFYKIFSFPHVIPEMPATEITEEYELPFALDAKSGVLNTDFAIRLTPERALLARLLADLCTDFILLHEAGHIVCGHLEGHRHLAAETQLAEFSPARKKRKYLRRAWEYEADVIASVLIVQHLDTLAELSQTQAHLSNIFRFCQDERDLRTRLVALLNVALFTLFLYKNRLCFELGTSAYHPPPLIRIYYVKNFVACQAEKDWGLALHLVEEWQDEYLDQFLIALENIGSFTDEDLKVDFEDTLEQSKRFTERCFRRCRGFTEKWSWLPRQIWSPSG